MIEARDGQYQKIMSRYVTGFAKRVFYAHNVKSHFSPPFDRYNNILTVRACTIAKGSMVFFSGLLGWSVNGSNLPDQADSRQGITTGLAGTTGH